MTRPNLYRVCAALLPVATLASEDPAATGPGDARSEDSIRCETVAERADCIASLVRAFRIRMVGMGIDQGDQSKTSEHEALAAAFEAGPARDAAAMPRCVQFLEDDWRRNAPLQTQPEIGD